MECLQEMNNEPPTFEELDKTANHIMSMLSECEKLWIKIHGSLKEITDTYEPEDEDADM